MTALQRSSPSCSCQTTKIRSRFEDTRLVPRLMRSAETMDDAQPIARSLEVSQRGTLENLAWQPLLRREPAHGEIELEVVASGLNFKDVLNTLGMYPGEAGPLGGECAGIITRVGPGVSHMRVGQSVLAVASGCLRSYVTTSANLVAPIPANLDYDAAATLAIPFVTARFGLENVGRLRRGERVLIHAAAGGVGLAAVQIAQLLGAEVFATAGSDEKRAYLKALGVTHVFDSRSIGFADAILEATAGRGVDVVLNSLAGELSAASLRVLARGGRFVELGERDLLTPEQVVALGRGIEYSAVDWGRTAEADPALIRGILLDVVTDVEAGRLRPLPVKTFSMDEVGAAFRFMAQASAHRQNRHWPRPPIRQRQPRSDLPDHRRAERTRFAVCRMACRPRRSPSGPHGPPRTGAAAQAVLNRLDRLGVQTIVARGDVSKSEDVGRILELAARSGPPLRGIIHSAGALDDGVLAQQAWPRFERALAAKVHGTWHLHAATRDLPLDFFVMFSSIASVFGSAGQANHAAANAFLDALASTRRDAGLPGLSINWGGWSEVGAAVERGVSGRLAERGLGLLAPSSTLALFDALLHTASPQIAVVPIDWPMFSQTRTAQRPLLRELVVRPARTIAADGPASSGPGEADLALRLATAPAHRHHALVLAWLQEQAGRVLNLDPAAVDARVPLSEMGLDSLMAVELRNLVRAGLGGEHTLPTTLAFDYPTLTRMTDFLVCEVLRLETNVGTDASAPTPAPAPTTLDSLEELTDDEVDRLLAVRLGNATGQVQA